MRVEATKFGNQTEIMLIQWGNFSTIFLQPIQSNNDKFNQITIDLEKNTDFVQCLSLLAFSVTTYEKLGYRLIFRGAPSRPPQTRYLPKPFLRAKTNVEIVAW